MDKKFEKRYFLIIKKRKILFVSFDDTKGSIPSREIYIDDYSIDSIYFSIENFLEKNIFEIEKNLNSFIKKIYIIFETDNFFLAETSIKHKIIDKNSNNNQIKESLIDIRNQFIKYSPEDETIHMLIKNFVIDGTTYQNLPKNIESKFLAIQVNFICMKKQILKRLKKIFSKYQISINKILSYEYLKDLDNRRDEDIIKLANDSIDGSNINEIFILRKTSKNYGFFEKFFNFFK